MTQRESVNVLQECIALQNKKATDYQHPNSNIVQAMHYRRGVDTIHDMIHQKVLRAQSLLESGYVPNFESIEDTYKDIINYASFAVSYLRGQMEGQVEGRDIFNQKIPQKMQVDAPCHTDLMVSPEEIDAYLAANPPPAAPNPTGVISQPTGLPPITGTMSFDLDKLAGDRQLLTELKIAAQGNLANLNVNPDALPTNNEAGC